MYNNQRVSLGDESMLINLYDILSVSGKELTLEGELESKKVMFHGEELGITYKKPVSITLKHIEKDTVYVEFQVEVTVNQLCSRCLSDVVCDYMLDVKRTINVAKKEACTDDSLEFDEISYIEDCTLDVDMLVLDELYTVIPMNVLCKEDCKGICKVCGTNLNKSTCNCDQTVPDPRMAVFSDIFNQFKEV